MSVGACVHCSRLKKRCEKIRPCKRCIDMGVSCEDKPTTRAKRRTGISYTSKACAECNRAKTRCGIERPCPRCQRLHIHCYDPASSKSSAGTVTNTLPRSVVYSYIEPGSTRLPPPDMEQMYHYLSQAMEAFSPFVAADLFTSGTNSWFISSVGCMSSLIPKARVRPFVQKLYSVANVPLSEVDSALSRIELLENPSSISPLPVTRYDVLPVLSDNELIYHYTFRHQFKVFNNFPSRRTRSGLNVSLFLRDSSMGKFVLKRHLSPQCADLFGYTPEQFSAMITHVDSKLYRSEEFPTAMCFIHNEDIFAYSVVLLKAFLTPRTEWSGRVRVIHSNCTFIPCIFTQIVELYPDGTVRAIISHFVPDF